MFSTYGFFMSGRFAGMYFRYYVEPYLKPVLVLPFIVNSLPSVAAQHIYWPIF